MHEIRVFIASFVVDYTALGNIYEGDSNELIDCWILSGRDQSSILKSMIDDTFVPEYGIGVNVKLIDATTLLPAVIARGPLTLRLLLHRLSLSTMLCEKQHMI